MHHPKGYQLTVSDYLSRYKESHTSDLTPHIVVNAEDLLLRVNEMLKETPLSYVPFVTSGWRPPSVNSKVKGAARHSTHTIGKGIDLADFDQELDKFLMANHKLLSKYGLWLEHPLHTPTWTHLDTRPRRPREIQVFLP